MIINYFLLLVTLIFNCMYADDIYIGNMSKFSQYVQPDQITCGPTCGAMVLNYYGINAGIQPVAQKAQTKWFSNGGTRFGMTHPEKLRDAVKSYGLDVGYYKGTMDNIIDYINNSIPVILLVRSGSETWHYIVVVGYNMKKESIIYVDPGDGEAYYGSFSDIGMGWNYSGTYTGSKIEEPVCVVCNGGGSLWTNCPTCSGTGKWRNKKLGFSTKCAACSGKGRWSSKCHTCGGDGRLVDIFRKLVEESGAVGHIMIVPHRSPSHTNYKKNFSHYHYIKSKEKQIVYQSSFDLSNSNNQSQIEIDFEVEYELINDNGTALHQVWVLDAGEYSKELSVGIEKNRGPHHKTARIKMTIPYQSRISVSFSHYLISGVFKATVKSGSVKLTPK